MSKYNRKKENPAVAQTDEFIGFWQKAFTRVQPFARAIAWSLIGFAGVVAVVGAVTTYLEHRAEAATEAWGRAVRIYEADLIGEVGKDKDKDKDHSDESLPHYKTAKERAEAALQELDKLPPVAAKNARLFRAGVLYNLERYDEAKPAYEQAAEGAAAELATVAREGVALCLEQLGKVDEALAAYDRVAPRGDKPSEFYRDRALFGAARLLEKKGDKAGAIERYKEIIAKFTASTLRDDAQNHLAVLEGP